MERRGVFIAVEGIDGSGLTSNSRMLVEALGAMGCSAFYTKEPTDGPVGRIIRRVLAGDEWRDHRYLALLFAADRLWHVYYDPSLPGSGGIAAALRLGVVVVSDRYKYSSIAYQGSYAGYQWVDELNRHAPEPDLIVFLDADPRGSLQRIRGRPRRELYEDEGHLERVKRGFEEALRIAESRGVRVVRVPVTVGGRDRSLEEVSREVVERVSPLLAPRCSGPR